MVKQSDRIKAQPQQGTTIRIDGIRKDISSISDRISGFFTQYLNDENHKKTLINGNKIELDNNIVMDAKTISEYHKLTPKDKQVIDKYFKVPEVRKRARGVSPPMAPYAPVSYTSVNFPELLEKEKRVIIRYLAWEDTMKDFPSITDELHQEILDDNGFKELIGSVIEILREDYKNNNRNPRTNLRYYDLLMYIINLDNHDQLGRILQLDHEELADFIEEDVDINHDKVAIFDRIFKTSSDRVHVYDLCKPTGNRDITGEATRYEIVLGPRDGPGIFALDDGVIAYNKRQRQNGGGKSKQDDVDDNIDNNRRCQKIVEDIFGADTNIIINAGFKTDGNSFKEMLVYTVARIFDVLRKSIEENDRLIDTGKSYRLTSHDNELYYLEELRVSDGKLVGSIASGAHKTYTTFINNRNIIHIGCLTNDIKTTINLCTRYVYNMYVLKKDKSFIKDVVNKYNYSRLLTPPAIGNKKLDDSVVVDDLKDDAIRLVVRILTDEKLACLSVKPNNSTIENIRLLTDLKRAGDFNTAQSALATGAVFATTDYVAASYAIMIGCKTLLCMKDRESNYVYYIYKPGPSPDARTGPSQRVFLTGIRPPSQNGGDSVAMMQLRERSRRDGIDYEKEMRSDCNLRIDRMSREDIDSYIDSERVRKYGYTTPLEYVVLRYMELEGTIPSIRELVSDIHKEVDDMIRLAPGDQEQEKLASLPSIGSTIAAAPGVVDKVQTPQPTSRMKLIATQEFRSTPTPGSRRSASGVRSRMRGQSHRTTGGAAIETAKSYRARLNRLKKKHEHFVASGGKASSKEYAELYDKMSQLYLDVKDALGR